MKHHIQKIKNSLTPRIIGVIIATLVGIVVLGGGTYAAFFTSTVRLNITVADVSIGSLSYDQAIARVQQEVDPLLSNGLTVIVGDKRSVISSKSIGLSYDVKSAVDTAWTVGRTGDIWTQAQQRATSLIAGTSIDLPVSYDAFALNNEIERIAAQSEIVPKDVRLVFSGTTVTVATDTASGQVVDHDLMRDTLVQAITQRKPGPFTFHLKEQLPSGTVESAQEAKIQAQRVLKAPLVMTQDRDSFLITPAVLATWIKSTPENNEVRVVVDTDVVEQYLVQLDTKLNVPPVEPVLQIQNGRVTSFTAPRNGKALDRVAALDAIVKELEHRRQDKATINDIALAATVTKPHMTDPIAKQYGIQELIGSATTDLSGSPVNRIWNIKTGARYLNNALVAPGKEFSTTGTLGNIDASTGYKQELVIKQNRTIPEYGGGLCQVSTTLFRSVLNAGLPITARSNHAYRVPYYEKDGNGRVIGPGLDATIYSPLPDFRFKNDTAASLVITSSVVGMKITFNVYGTPDGRVATIDGPHTLSTTPSGDPVYIETDTLKPGEKKQVEHPHAGGTAIATYTVTYPNGTEKKDVFKSVYKNWPATYLIGKAADAPAAAPGTTDPAVPTTPTTPTDPAQLPPID